jgi:hypothetical protein
MAQANTDIYKKNNPHLYKVEVTNSGIIAINP